MNDKNAPEAIVKSYFDNYDKDKSGSIDAKEIALISQDLVRFLKFIFFKKNSFNYVGF